MACNPLAKTHKIMPELRVLHTDTQGTAYH